MIKLTDLNLTFAMAEHKAARERCADCDALLTVAWGGKWGIEDYVIRCSANAAHQGLARPYQPSPFAIPGFNLTQQSIKRRHKMVKELEKQQPGAGALMKYHGQVLSEIGATEVISTLWPGAAKEAVWKAIQICIMYELNPLMRHVFLIKFDHFEGKGDLRKKVGEDWEVVLGIQANRLIAHRAGDFSYLDNTPRVMSLAEQREILGEVDEVNLWAITKLRDSKGNEAQGYGNWAKKKVYGDKEYDNEPKGTDKGNSKFNMAFIRSERNAFDRLFAGKMPQGVEVADERYIEVKEVVPDILVDKATGEILEAPEHATSLPPDADGASSPLDPEYIAWLGEAIKAAFKSRLEAVATIADWFGVPKQRGVTLTVAQLSPEQREELKKKLGERIDLKN